MAAASGSAAALATGAPAAALHSTPANIAPVSGARPGSTPVPLTNAASRASIEVITVSKCYTNATRTRGGEMLIKAQSSKRAARLFAYRPDGSLIGELQNGGGSRYGGSVMPYQPYDPVKVTIKSSAGGRTTVRTTPFQQ